MGKQKEKLISVADFARKYFSEESKPAPATVRSWVDSGAIKGRVIESGLKKTYYIDENAWQHSSGHSDVDDFLSDMSDAA